MAHDESKLMPDDDLEDEAASLRGIDWPRHERRRVPWQQQFRGGTREDRMLREIDAAIPPFIAAADVQVPSYLLVEMESALREIAALDTEHSDSLGALGTVLLRTECVASSRIEEIDAAIDDYARALHGVRANPSARSMVDATRATDVLLRKITATSAIELDDLLAAHRELMTNEASEQDYAGRLRDMQNWIGGSKHSPRNALYIPPPAGTLATYMADLIDYVNRDDVAVLVQAAIAHAQFESIHPFTDGNGRIGRALINSILRRREVTKTVVVPLASALVAHRDRYFDELAAYRDGDPIPLLRSFATGTRIASAEARITARHLTEIPGQWRDLTGPIRRHSATAKIMETLIEVPVLTAADVVDRLGLSPSSAYNAIGLLHGANVIRPLTNRKRDQIWGASLVLDELDDLGARIHKAAT